MGFLDSFFSSPPGQGGMSDHLRKDYEKFGFDPDDEGGGPIPNKGKKMYCTMCHRIYNGGVKCSQCNNILVEWH